MALDLKHKQQTWGQTGLPQYQRIKTEPSLCVVNHIAKRTSAWDRTNINVVQSIKDYCFRTKYFYSYSSSPKASEKQVQLLLYLAGGCCLSIIPKGSLGFQSVGQVTSSLHGMIFSGGGSALLLFYSRVVTNPSKKTKSNFEIAFVISKMVLVI